MSENNTSLEIEGFGLKQYPIPLPLEEIKDDIIITTNSPSQLSKQELIKQAFKYHSEGNISEALKYYQYFIKNGFIDHRIFSNCGVILKDLGKLEEAQVLQRKAIKIKPDFADSYSNLGIILKDLGKLKEAELLLRKAIKLKPDFANALFNLAIILNAHGKSKEAELLLRKVIKLKPNFAQAYSNLGNILRDYNQLKEAELLLRKAVKLKPSLAEAHSNLGTILRELGNLKEAELSTLKAIELKTNFAEAHSNLGNILMDLGKLNEAELYARKAIKLKPNFAEAYSNLGIILRELGNLKLAELSTLKAIELKPNSIGTIWNLYSLSKSIDEAEIRINKCLKIDNDNLKANHAICSLMLHKGDNSLLKKSLKSTNKNHPYIRSLEWASNLPYLPEIFFNRWTFYDNIISKSKIDRPFYEFGVWRGNSFKYLIKSLKKGYGFDTFIGLPENWHNEKIGTYSADGNIPEIDGGIFIAGKFEETLPKFFLKPRAKASIINFDSDLYSSTLCALNHSKHIIDNDTILIFDEFIINETWEQDEYKALKDFSSKHNLAFDVIAISYVTKQVAVKFIDYKI